MSDKFVTLNFTHQSESDVDVFLSKVRTHLRFDTLETYTEDFEEGYLTDVYLKGDVDDILRSVEDSYENKNINCSWSIVDEMD
jgi:hypothetical protein